MVKGQNRGSKEKFAFLFPMSCRRIESGNGAAGIAFLIPNLFGTPQKTYFNFMPAFSARVPTPEALAPPPLDSFCCFSLIFSTVKNSNTVICPTSRHVRPGCRFITASLMPAQKSRTCFALSKTVVSCSFDFRLSALPRRPLDFLLRK